MSQSKTYVRRHPDNVRARALEADEVVYDGLGEPLRFHPGDILVEPLGRFARYVMSPEMFYQIYMEVDPPHDNRPQYEQDLPPSQLPDLQQR